MRHLTDWPRFREQQKRGLPISEGWERKKRKEPIRQPADLIVVDVQDNFSQYFSDRFVELLFDYCRTFQRVFQVWDGHEAEHPSHEFPGQTKTYEKHYGLDLDASDFEDYFMPDVEAQVKSDMSAGPLTPGKMYPEKRGAKIVYVGNKHEWFMCPKGLSELFSAMHRSGRKVVLVGGAYGECLEDVYQAAKAHGVDASINEQYTYSCLDKE